MYGRFLPIPAIEIRHKFCLYGVCGNMSAFVFIRRFFPLTTEFNFALIIYRRTKKAKRTSIALVIYPGVQRHNIKFVGRPFALV